MDLQVKDEPIDPGYEAALQTPVVQMENGETGAQTPANVIYQNTDSSQNIRSILNNMLIQDKELTVKSVIDDLLRRNSDLLEQVDASIYKPQPRNVVKKGDDSSKNSPKPTEQGQILRPESPTRTGMVQKKNMPNIGETMRELSVLDEDTNKALESLDSEVVCGIASKAYVMTLDGVNIKTEVQFYWCNFCPFKTESKDVLLHHVMDHRFHCKYCEYQSYSRADVIQHACDHEEFKDTAKNMKYCIFSLDGTDLEVSKKRALESEEVGNSASKKSRSDNKRNDDYDAFDMEVDEVDDENNYTRGASTTDKIIMPSKAKKVTAGKSKTPKATSNVSPSPIQPKPTTNLPTPSTPTVNMQSTTTGKSGNTVTVSSGLCWNCGYCDFVTLSQTFLKTHLNSQHHGKAHKYVAMLVSSQEEMNKIKERDAKMYTSPNLALVYGSVTANMDKTAASSNTSVAVNNDSNNATTPEITPQADNNSAPAPINEGHAEDSDDEEYIPAEEKKKYPLTYKCAHCNFNAPVCFKIKEHLQSKHNGCVLYALDMRAVKLKQRRYVFFCHRKNCSFTTKKTEEYLNHSESCTPWLLDDCPEQVDNLSKKCLELTRSFSSKISQKAFQMAKNFKSSKSAEYACIHCSYTSNNNTRVKKHVLSNHKDYSTVMKDLQSHKMNKKTHVHFCKYCLWETRNEEELTGHLQEKHADEVSNTPKAPQTPVVETPQTPPVQVQPPPVIEKPTPIPKQKPIISPVDSPAPTSPTYDESANEEEEDEEEEEEIEPEDLEVSDEDVQKMMTEYVKDEASRGTSPGRPTRKASLEASVRVRAQGHQPPMYRCMHCTHLCFGSNLMKKHIRQKHKNEAFRAVDVKKKTSKQFAYFCFCPQENCKYFNSNEEAVITHATQDHKMKKDHVDLQRLLQPFTFANPPPDNSSNVNTESSGSSMKNTTAYECLYCTISCLTEEMMTMKIHILKEHPGEEIIFRDCIARKLRKSSRVFMCEKESCHYTNTEQKEYELHRLAHDKAHIYECAKCQWFTATTETVNSHMSTVHKGEHATTIEMNLDLDAEGNVIKKVGGTVIKQESAELVVKLEPIYS